MGDGLEVKVLWGTWSQGPRVKRKACDREVAAERSVERNRESTNRNRIGGSAEQGERATDREAVATKGSGVDPAIVRRRPHVLPGEISPDA